MPLFGGPGANGLIDLSGLRGDAIATLLYVNNWHLIFAHQSYFAQFSTPSPLQHTWSLAIEEQFYLVWPLVLLVLLRFGRRGWRRLGRDGHRRPRRGLLGADGGPVQPRRRSVAIYYGTDTRLFDLMAGATLAFLAASRGQPGARARRTLHWVGPAAAVVLAVFWVRAGTPGGLPTNFMFEGGFLLCAALAGLIVADARLVEPGWFARGAGLEAAALRRHHLLRDLPLALAGDRLPQRRPDRLVGLAAEPPADRGHAARLDGQLLPGRAADPLGQVAGWPPGLDRPGGRRRHRRGDRRRHHPGRRRSHQGGRHHPPRLLGLGAVGAGCGGVRGPAAHPADAGAVRRRIPLRVMILGDSVMHDASYGITASLQATGEATVSTQTIDGFGLDDGDRLADLHPQPHPPDPGPAHRGLVELGPVRADHAQRAAPAGAVHRPPAQRRRHHAGAGQRRGGGHLHRSSRSRATSPRPIRPTRRATTRSAGPASSPGTTSPRRWRRQFPGRVMYFPLADSILLHGKYSAWLPPEGDPHAPSAPWLRVRKLDNVHLCPEGSARYAAALLADMTAVFGLAPAAANWSQGAWTTDPDFNDPPGACPDDHPPG